MFRTAEPKPINWVARTCSIVMIAMGCAFAAGTATYIVDPQPAAVWAEDPANVWGDR